MILISTPGHLFCITRHPRSSAGAILGMGFIWKSGNNYWGYGFHSGKFNGLIIASWFYRRIIQSEWSVEYVPSGYSALGRVVEASPSPPQYMFGKMFLFNAVIGNYNNKQDKINNSLLSKIAGSMVRTCRRRPSKKS